MTVTVALGDCRDADSVMPVMSAAFDPLFGEAWSAAQVGGMLAVPGSWLTVLSDEGNVVGFALTRSLLDEVELMLLAVHPDKRHRGFGRRLLQEVIAEARQRSCRRILLEMRADNASASTLYTSAGFARIGRRPGYYRGQDGVLRDAVTMALNII